MLLSILNHLFFLFIWKKIWVNKIFNNIFKSFKELRINIVDLLKF